MQSTMPAAKSRSEPTLREDRGMSQRSQPYIRHRVPLVVAFSILFILLFSSQALAAEIKVFCLPGLRGVLNALGPKFESASGHKLAMTYEVNTPLMRRIDASEKFDVAIITPAEIENLKSRGKVAADSRSI